MTVRSSACSLRDQDQHLFQPGLERIQWPNERGELHVPGPGDGFGHAPLPPVQFGLERADAWQEAHDVVLLEERGGILQRPPRLLGPVRCLVDQRQEAGRLAPP